MANTRINTTELLSLLDITPADQNVMLVGNHGIGKFEILTEYFSRKGMKVVPLFLGQMSDPGDLIGIPNRNTETGKTEFMPPYWFPLDGKPIVLFLDELNRPDMNVNILFIDEGIGTLDEKSLDSVMGTLEKLQEIAGQTERRVGIISHREELDERIPVKIQVEKKGEGRSKVKIKNTL